jgi:hypothetical protein
MHPNEYKNRSLCEALYKVYGKEEFNSASANKVLRVTNMQLSKLVNDGWAYRTTPRFRKNSNTPVNYKFTESAIRILQGGN